MVDFNKLKKSKDHLIRLQAQIEKMEAPKEGSFEKDDRFWTPTQDKAGNGFAEIRFLPGAPIDGDDAPDFVTYYSHSIKGPTGKWYIENSLTTLGKKDPVGEMNRRLWATNEKRYQEIVSSWKRKLNYISNIYVVNDAGNPENNGKVFKYRFGKKIYDKQKLAMFPVIPTKKPMNPYDVFEGANFQLVVTKVGKHNNYDQSEFGAPSRLAPTDEEIKAIWEKEYSILEDIAPDKFKSYEELKAELDKALGCDSESDKIFEVVLRKAPEGNDRKAQKETPANVRQPAAEETAPWDSEEETNDEDAAFFQRMAKGN